MLLGILIGAIVFGSIGLVVGRWLGHRKCADEVARLKYENKRSRYISGIDGYVDSIKYCLESFKSNNGYNCSANPQEGKDEQ